MSRRKKRLAPPVTGTRRPIRLALVVVGTVVVLAALALGFHMRRRQARHARTGPLDNLLLITLDTTRADHLGCYGYASAKTRHLDRLAAEGARFEWAYSPAPITLPAHASILTGLQPPTHGVRNNGNFYLAETHETLTTVLKNRGYRTAAFVSAFVLDRRYGLARGFDVYDDFMQGSDPQVVQLEAERRGDRTALALSHWLESAAAAPPARPFFAWLHLYDPHEPYRPPRPFRDLFATAPYDGEIAFDDAIVASVLDTLQRVGALQRTLVAVIGDHGESLGEHGEETHSMLLYEAAIRIPLLLWRPGVVPTGRVVREPVRAVDLAPTVLDLLGVPSSAPSDGRSLVPLLFEEKPARPASLIYAETYLPQLYMNWAPLRSIRSGGYKLIDAPHPELYDLVRDPAESRNLYDVQPETASALLGRLHALTGGGEGAMSVGGLDREASEKLAALGYVGAAVLAQGPAPGASRVDPKQMIGVFNRLRSANSAVRDRRYEDALPILREVLAADPRNAFAQLVLGSAHMGRGEYHLAIAQFKKYLALVPTSSYAHQWMAICHLRLGDQSSALKEAEAALAIDSRYSDARVLKAGVLASRGDHRSAIAELRSAVATDPAKPILRIDLAKVLAEAGRVKEAQAEYQAVLETRPGNAAALIGTAELCLKQGKLDQAETALRRALVSEPESPEARFDLAEVLTREGHTKEAVELLRKVASAAAAAPEVRRAARERLARLSE